MKLYDSLSQTKTQFIPHDKENVTMYVCGITPYDTTHLGHAFTYTFFDTLRRYLESKNYKVNYTQNVTDIDDDVLKRAKQEKRDWQELGTYWTDHFLKDLKSLHIAMPTNYVKATDSIPEIITIIKKLLTDGFAYEKNGNVYFRTAKDKEYGKLSHYSPQQMLQLSKERGANPDDPNKEAPLDFILWQKSKPDEPYWDDLILSKETACLPAGRPGWHIECSAMVNRYLGEQIDIHGGGRDLVYPHHESEIAQSEHFTGKKPYVKYWLHTSMVMYQGEKMSKSLGNLVMVSELLKKYSPNAIRYVLLSHHYRTPWEFHHEELDAAEKKLHLITKAIGQNKISSKHGDQTNFVEEFDSALQNDMDTPEALKIITNASEKIITATSPKLQKDLKQMLEILGFT